MALTSRLILSERLLEFRPPLSRQVARPMFGALPDDRFGLSLAALRAHGRSGSLASGDILPGRPPNEQRRANSALVWSRGEAKRTCTCRAANPPTQNSLPFH